MTSIVKNEKSELKQQIIRYCVSVISVFGIIGCIAVLFPQVRQLIMELAERYLIHRTLNRPDIWFNRLFVYAYRFIICIIICDFFTLTIWGRLILNKIKNAMKPQLRELDFKLFVKPVLIMSGIYVLALLSLIRANFSYSDDLHRAIHGQRGWVGWSRYISNILAIFIHTNSNISDISPLPQLIAIFLLAISCVLLVYLLGNKKIITLSLFASVPVGLSPYFLQCLSYKFDSPYMALSIVTSIMPFLFIESRIIFIASSILGLLVMCMTYQASSGIYILLTIILCFQNWNRKEKSMKDILKFAGIAMVTFIFTMIFFRVVFMQLYSGYGVSTAMFSHKYILFGILVNIKQYTVQTIHNFNMVWKIGIVLVCIFFVYHAVKTSKQAKFIACIVSIFVIFALYIMSFGVYLVLETPLFAPRAMYGFGVFIAILCICVTTRAAKISSLSVLALNWCFVVFACIYGNALVDQKRYTDFRAELLLHDLSNLFPDRKKTDMKLQLENDIGYAPIVQKIIKQYPITKELVPIDIDGSIEWTYYYLLEYFNWGTEKMANGKPNTQTVELMAEFAKHDFSTMDLPILLDSYYHTIKSDGERILIVLKQGE
ncbi:MAG: glucosyltransferase domain-containing protein [Treponema sp.]|jgi:hypothetical protein|nr:glucosyltransferase domain-containing protein [Treponema sp.]